MLKSAVLILSVSAFAAALFSTNSKVVRLDLKNFDKLVLQSETVWFVKFYATWCGHCQQFAPEFELAAEALNGVVRLGAVNVEVEKRLAAKYQIRGFPTVKIFIVDKNKAEDFRGERNAKTLVNAAMSAVQRKVNYQLSGKADRGSTFSLEDVVKLTDNNFKDMVLESQKMWMVMFHAPWCQTCRNLEPIWAEAATELKGKVLLGVMDVSKNRATSEIYGIKEFPTIKYFPIGVKNDALDYKERNTKVEIVDFALKKLLESKPPPECKQITSYQSFKESCADEQLCIISFLPHLLDCQSECRHSYLNALKNVSEKFKEKPWGWVWTEAIAQPELENALEVGGFGYPAMIVVSITKMKFSVLRSAFSEVGIGEFLRDLSYGRGHVFEMRTEISIREITAWDGKDADQPEDEDIIEDKDVEIEEEGAKCKRKEEGKCMVNDEL